MNGLLDFIKTPEGQGLLAAGFGGLAGARRNAPFNTLGMAGMAGLQGYAGAQDRQSRMTEEAQMRQLREQQLQQARYANEAANRDQQIRDMAAKFAIPAQRGWFAMPADESAGIQAMPAQEAKPSGFDVAGYIDAVSGIDPMKAIQLRQAMAKESNFNKIDVDKFTPQSLAKYSQSRNYGDLVPRNKLEFVEGVGVDPYDPKNAGRSIPNPNKPFSVSTTGEFVPNTPFQQYETQKAAAGAARQYAQKESSGKAPAGYRYLPNGDMEAVPGGPADVKAQASASLRATGASDVDSAIGTLRSAYDRLESGGGITSTNKGGMANAGAALGSSGFGQMVGKTLGTSNQSARNDIAMTRPALLAALMKATGMSAKQMDSNAELKLWMATATDPTLDVESNRRALDSIERKYLGQPSPSNANLPTPMSPTKANAATFDADKESRYQAWVKSQGGAK